METQGSLPSHNTFWRILRIPQDHFQAIIHSGEYFVSPRTRNENFSTLASFAASALAGWPLSAAPRASLRGEPSECLRADPISVSPVDWFGTLRPDPQNPVANMDEEAAKEPTNLPPRGKARGASKRSRTYLSNAVHPAMVIRHLLGTVAAAEFRDAL